MGYKQVETIILFGLFLKIITIKNNKDKKLCKKTVILPPSSFDNPNNLLIVFLPKRVLANNFLLIKNW